MILHPEKLRFAGIQNVTINLPQCAYKTFPNNNIAESSLDYNDKDNLNLFLEKIDQALCLAVKAHLHKKKFLKMMMENPSGPLWLITG